MRNYVQILAQKVPGTSFIGFLTVYTHGIQKTLRHSKEIQQRRWHHDFQLYNKTIKWKIYYF